MEPITRRDTLKFLFDRESAKPKSIDFEEWLETTVHVPLTAVVGIYFSILRHEVYLKLTSTDICDQIVRDTGGFAKYRYPDGTIREVQIIPAGLGFHNVRIFELPFEVSADVVTQELKKYGTVISNFAERYSAGHRYPVLNGIRQVRIDLRKHIPSYLQIGGHRAVVIYEGQPKTCAGCGATGHVRADCIQRRITQLPREERQTASGFTILESSYANMARRTFSSEVPKDVIMQDDLMIISEPEQMPTGVEIKLRKEVPESERETVPLTQEKLRVAPGMSETSAVQEEPQQANIMDMPIPERLTNKSDVVRVTDTKRRKLVVNGVGTNMPIPPNNVAMDVQLIVMDKERSVDTQVSSVVPKTIARGPVEKEHSNSVSDSDAGVRDGKESLLDNNIPPDSLCWADDGEEVVMTELPMTAREREETEEISNDTHPGTNKKPSRKSTRKKNSAKEVFPKGEFY